MENFTPCLSQYKVAIYGLFLSSIIFHSDIYGMFSRKVGLKKESNLLKIQASDGITAIPFCVAKTSKIIDYATCGLKRIPEEPIALTQYSRSVIADICTIITQKFIFPEKIEKQIAQYSLKQLVERYNCVDYLDFSENIQDIFRNKIISTTNDMGLKQIIIDNKDTINLLNQDTPALQPLFDTVKTPYLIIRSPNGPLYLFEPFYAMSAYLSKCTSSANYIIYNENREIKLDKNTVASLAIINLDLHKTHSIRKQITTKNYPLEQLIPIVNCLDYLMFPDDIQRIFHEKIYSLCKGIAFEEIIPQLKTLSSTAINHIFGNAVIEKLKFSLIEKTLDDKKTIFDIASKVALTQNEKMFALYEGATLQLWSFNNKDIANLSQELFIENNICTIAFSPNNKKLAIGTCASENNILIYDIDDIDSKKTIARKPQVLVGHPNSNMLHTNIAFNPKGTLMVSANKYTANNNELLLWTINENGIINDEPIALLTDHLIISPIKFNADGTMFILTKRSCKEVILSIFDENCSLKSSYNIQCPNAYEAIFHPHDKKIIIAGRHLKEDNWNDLSEEFHWFYIYDFTDEKNITHRPLLHSNRCINLFKIVNDTTLIGSSSLEDKNVFCFNMDDQTCPLLEKYGTTKYDTQRILSSCASIKAAMSTILTPQSLNSINALDWDQIILIERILRGEKNLPSLKDYEIPKSIAQLVSKKSMIKKTEIVNRSRIIKPALIDPNQIELIAYDD